MMKILLDDKDTFITTDPEHRPVRAIIIDSCPCGHLKGFALFVTRLPHFGFHDQYGQRNVWHYEVTEINGVKTISITPSILLDTGDLGNDHFYITDCLFEWNHLE